MRAATDFGTSAACQARIQVCSTQLVERVMPAVQTENVGAAAVPVGDFERDVLGHGNQRGRRYRPGRILGRHGRPVKAVDLRPIDFSHRCVKATRNVRVALRETSGGRILRHF
jgi:hypothetical protein